MTGWEQRAWRAFGDQHFHKWENMPFTYPPPPEYQRVAYVCEADLCAFLRIKPTTMRRWVGAALTWHNAQPDTYTLALDAEGVLYRWQALEAVLGVPGLIAPAHQVRVSGIMKNMYAVQFSGREYEYRHETDTDWRARVTADYEMRQERGRRFGRRMERLQPGWNEAMRSVAKVAVQAYRDIMAIYDAAPDDESVPQQETQKLLTA